MTGQEALHAAIQTLKEIQQYMAIGTVEECQKAVEKQNMENNWKKIPNNADRLMAIINGAQFGISFPTYYCLDSEQQKKVLEISEKYHYHAETVARVMASNGFDQDKTEKILEVWIMMIKAGCK